MKKIFSFTNKLFLCVIALIVVFNFSACSFMDNNASNNKQNSSISNNNNYDSSANYTLTFTNDFPLQLQEKVYHNNGVLLRNNKIEITKVDYKIKSSTYSTFISIYLSIIAKKTYASGYVNYKSVSVDYKIYDEDGVVIKNGSFDISSDIDETVKTDTIIYISYDTSPKPDKYNYKIEFSM